MTFTVLFGSDTPDYTFVIYKIHFNQPKYKKCLNATMFYCTRTYSVITISIKHFSIGKLFHPDRPEYQNKDTSF